MRRTHGYALVLVCLTLSAALSACMISPGDSSIVSGTSSTINFSGFYQQPNKTVTVTAYDFSTDTYVPIASAQTASSGITVWEMQWYHWSVNATIPTNCWEPGIIDGWRAMVRSRVGSVNLYSVYADYKYQALGYSNWMDCLLDNQDDITDFGSNCTSFRTPDAYVMTEDYQNPPG